MNVGPPAPLQGRPHDPMNIGLYPFYLVLSSHIHKIHPLFTRTDSASFDAKAYYEQLITTTSLTGLLKQENELSAGLSPLRRLRVSVIVSSDFFGHSF